MDGFREHAGQTILHHLLRWRPSQPCSKINTANSFASAVYRSACRSKDLQTGVAQPQHDFQLTPCGAKLGPHMIQGIGNFQICVSMYHRIGSRWCHVMASIVSCNIADMSSMLSVDSTKSDSVEQKPATCDRNIVSKEALFWT